jgi:serine/threonine-protein kinase
LESYTRLGRYELLGHLATGGMAEIHLARLAGIEGFERIVVVKRLLPELVASKAYVAMLLDEGKLAGRLDHPNVCEVFELGREGAEYFLVMPYLDGVPATDFIARPHDPDRMAQLRVACGIAVQACAGLHHAHELRGADGAPLGLVHRDVSPSNLFVTTAGVVKVLDFGIAKVRGAAETEIGTIKGKTQYMAPEQVLGEPLDRRCDVFALGIVLFELATHQRLFKRDSDYLTARAILEEPVPRADAVDPAVPAALADVIARALERDRERRFADARELARAIEGAARVATADDIAAAITGWHGDGLSALRTRQQRVLGSHVKTVPLGPRRRRYWPLVAAGAIAAAGTTFALTRSSTVAPSVDTAIADGSSAATVAIGAGPSSAPPAGAGSSLATPIGAGSSIATAAGAGSSIEPSAGGSATAPPVAVHPVDAHREHAGRFSIDSTPYATIFIDGKRLDITPISRRSLRAGHHRVRAVLADGRHKDFSIDVPSGGDTNPIHLTW